MHLNIKKYQHYIDHLDLTQRQKEQFIKTVWGMMESSVDQAFGLHPVQQIRGYVANDNLQSPVKEVDSTQSLIRNQFKHNALNAEKGVQNHDKSNITKSSNLLPRIK